MRADQGTRTPTAFAVLRGLVGAVLFGGAALAIFHDWLAVGGGSVDYAINGPIYDAVIVAAGLACLLKARGASPERAAWLTIAAAVLAWGAAEIYWTAAIEGNPNAPYPSLADAGYLAFYPLAALGLVLLVRARAHQLDWRLWMDGLIVSLGTAALGSALVFEFVAARTSGSTLEVVTTLAYPIGDVFLIALAIGVVALTGWRPGRTWSLLLAGLVASAVADVAYTLQTFDETLPGGDWVEPIYLLSAVFIGAVAWLPDMETIDSEAHYEGWREFVAPGLVAVAMIGLVSLQYFNGASALTTALWAAAMLAVLVRLTISVRENRRLLEEVRTDQLTGLGNHGSLEQRLSARCAEADQHPFALLMLDLNGFKRYNDSFGHPAGDAMLIELGGRLREAVKGHGSAYRIGGDEFAVLIDDVREHREVAKLAAEAFTASGKGFELSGSWGVAAIPEEAADPLEALRLADVRMYAQKESRRLSSTTGPAADAADPRLGRAGDREALEQGQ